MEKKKCPICNEYLEEIEVENKYGLKMRIDRCPSGCGFWFDQFELYQMSLKGSEKLIEDLPSKNPQEKDKLLCPVCQISMTKMKLSYFSEEVVFDYCKGCSGVWLDRERLLKYKSLQEEKGKEAYMNLLKAEGSDCAGSGKKKESRNSMLDFLLKIFGDF